jgi:serine/threonine protein phosphatase PrpC
MAGHRLTKMKYRWAIASEIGTSHLKNQTKKQDSARCFLVPDKSEILVGIVCDGAGSAPFGRDGAISTCKILANLIKEHFKVLAELPSEETIWSWVDQVRDSLAIEAQNRSCSRKDFSTTLVMIIATGHEILTVHVGDGAIVARGNDDSWSTISESENGEYASTTFFITEDPNPRLRIKLIKNTYNAFSLFSDGIEDLALIQSTKAPFIPFFEKMISSIDQDKSMGNLQELSKSLGTFLGSNKICERTDDDKSLILISTK